MLGVFDSGLGGLAFIKSLENTGLNLDLIYLGDNKNSPYGDLDEISIYNNTLAGVKYLFNADATLVILACNTASANALRKIQQEYLPKHYPQNRVLGVLVPAVEKSAKKNDLHQNILIFATPATVKAGAYAKEIKKINPRSKILEFPCPNLVKIIEQYDLNNSQIEEAIKNYVTAALLPMPKPDQIILGCTHYELVENIFKKYLPASCQIINPSQEAVDKFANYLSRHPDIAVKLSRNNNRAFYLTKANDLADILATKFLGQPIDFKIIDL